MNFGINIIKDGKITTLTEKEGLLSNVTYDVLEDNFGQREITDKTRKYFDVVTLNIWGDREVTVGLPAARCARVAR